MNKQGAKLIVGLLPLLLGACSALGIGSAEYGCSGMPQGVSCKSAREVYELTNTRDHVDGAGMHDEAPGQSGASAEAVPGQPARRVADPAALGGAPVRYSPTPVPYTDDGRVPIRTPAVVMRVWVAPYQDTNGDLHMPGLVFSEVEPRKWQVGLPESASGSPLSFRPLEMSAPKAKPVANDKASARPATPAARAEQVSSITPIKQGK